MNINYADNVIDNHFWLSNALWDFFLTRPHLENHFDMNGIITITKPIHPDGKGILHFTFTTGKTTYHAYTDPKPIIINGQSRTIGIFIKSITYAIIHELV
jgi:hypothetical protein